MSARVAKQVYARDLKSCMGNRVRVRFPPLALIILLISSCIHTTQILPHVCKEEINLVKSIWLKHNYPHTLRCEDNRLRLYFTNNQELTRICPGVEGIVGCFYPYYSNDVDLIVIDSTTNSLHQSIILRHELIHWLSWCSGLEWDGDKDHSNENLWKFDKQPCHDIIFAPFQCYNKKVE